VLGEEDTPLPKGPRPKAEKLAQGIEAGDHPDITAVQSEAVTGITQARRKHPG